MRLAGVPRFDRHRRAAVEALELGSGERVVDVGCGRGQSLQLLHEAVGPSGSIVGVDSDADAIAHCVGAVSTANWVNVELLHVSASAADWGEHADAALLAYTPDLVLEPSAVLNVLRQLKPQARVVQLDRLAGHARARPWRLLATYLADFRVETLGLGATYMTRGTVPPGSARRGR